MRKYADFNAINTCEAGIPPSKEKKLKKHFMEKNWPYAGLQKAALVLVLLCTTGNSAKTICP